MKAHVVVVKMAQRYDFAQNASAVGQHAPRIRYFLDGNLCFSAFVQGSAAHTRELALAAHATYMTTPYEPTPHDLMY